MHVILTGATGTCGAAVLEHCLANSSITRLTILSRRPVAQAEGHSKATLLIHKDFTQYPPLVLDQLKGAEACIWALGVSTTQVGKKEYINITYDYTMAAARAFSQAGLSDRFKFVFVSGEGSDPTERSTRLFANIKGRTEKHLYELSSHSPSFRIFVARPGMIDPEGEDLATTSRSRLQLAARALLAPVLRWGAQNLVIGTRPLARVLTDLALGDGEPIPEGPGVEDHGRTLRNIALRRLGGL